VTNYGGTTDPSNFSFKVNDGKTTAFEDDGSNSMEVAVGTYNIVETDTPGYKTTYDNCRNIKVEVGSTENCYISNTAIPGTLTVNKTVDNQNGGTAVASDFSIKINDRDGGSFVDTTSSEGSLVFNKLRTGVYSVVENNSEGYSATYENCTDLRIGLGENVTCEITNSDKPALLHIIKTLIQDNGATDLLSDFSVKINDRGPVSFDSKGKIELSVPAGKYNVGEVESDAYKTTYKGCKVELKNGEEATCYITNDDNPANVTLYKKVINNNGGRKDALDFVLTVAGKNGFEQYATSGVSIILDAGKYKFGEIEKKAYKNLGWLKGDCSKNGLLNVKNGREYKCVLVNNDKPGRIIVHKKVINNNGGTKKAKHFRFKVDSSKLMNFEKDGTNVVKVDAGWHTIVEAKSPGYNVSYKGCTEIHVKNGQTKHCYIKNNDKAPSLTLVKEVVNNDGGERTKTEWTLQATGTLKAPTDLSGAGGVVSGSDFKADTYTLSETGPNGYSPGKWSCDNKIAVNDKNEITLKLGQTTTCTITNDDVAPTVKLTKVVINDNSGTAKSDDFNLTIDGQHVLSGDTNPFEANKALAVDETLLDGYAFVSITGDDSCPYYLGGEVTLSPGENIECTITNDDIPNPAINVVKTGPSSSPAGADVEYTFTVTNTGDVALTDITVVDNIIGDATYVSGDTNNDTMLDTTETWIYTGTYSIPENQVANVNNTVEACGTEFIKNVYQVSTLQLVRFIDDGIVDEEPNIGTEVCGKDDHSLTIPKVLGETTSTPELAVTGQSQYMSIFSGLFIAGVAIFLGRKRPTSTSSKKY